MIAVVIVPMIIVLIGMTVAIGIGIVVIHLIGMGITPTGKAGPLGFNRRHHLAS